MESSVSTASHSGSSGTGKKKSDVNAKIQISEFGGKQSNPHDYANAFRRWARGVLYYREYYEDEYLMSLVVSACVGDAADVFDFA